MKQILSSALLVLLVIGAFWVGQQHSTIRIDTPLKVDTTKVDVAFPDSLPSRPPQERILYKEVVDTTRVTVPVPTRYASRMTFAAPSPIDVTASRVTFRRWDVSTRQFVDDVYRVPVSDYSYGILTDATVYKHGYAAFAGPYLRYKHGFVSPGVALSEHGTSFALRFGLRYEF